MVLKMNRNMLSPNICVETDLPPSPISTGTSEFCTTKDDKDESKLQECWDKSIATRLKIPIGYHNVHVLMIKWKDEIDQLQTRKEVNDLSSLFKTVFNFEVTEIQLGTDNSEMQLFKEVTAWIFDKDNKDNLLIVYYAGHGIFDQKKRVLEWTPTNKDAGPRVIWNQAMRLFEENVKADVFVLMDCCYASDIFRGVSDQERTFEMLAASGVGMTTPQPGEYSFTNRLIRHLKDLVEEKPHGVFTTRDVEERMKKELHEYSPQLWRVLRNNSRHIRLSPLKPQEQQRETSMIPSHLRFLHLGFALKEDVFSEAHIHSLTKKLPELFGEEGLTLTNIRWLGCRRTGHATFREVAEFVKKHRADLSSLSPSPRRKRTIDQAGLGDDDMACNRVRMALDCEQCD